MIELLVIANGRLLGGSWSTRWNRASRRLKEIFGNRIEVQFTACSGDATRTVNAALKSGVTWIVAAGGDGTFNEAANGFFEQGCNIRPEASLSFLPCGSGNDWVRTLGSPRRLDRAIESLTHSRIRTIDVGHATFLNLHCATEERIFINIAEAGVGGRLLARRQHRASMLEGWFRYRLEALVTAFTFSAVEMRLAFDGGHPSRAGKLLSLIVANGRYFGAGMHCAPMAKPDDGILEAITLGDFGSAELLLKIGKFFKGRYLNEPKIGYHPVKSLQAASSEPVHLELDGELAGTLPAEFRVLTGALRIRC